MLLIMRGDTIGLQHFSAGGHDDQCPRVQRWNYMYSQYVNTPMLYVGVS